MLTPISIPIHLIHKTVQCGSPSDPDKGTGLLILYHVYKEIIQEYFLYKHFVVKRSSLGKRSSLCTQSGIHQYGYVNWIQITQKIKKECIKHLIYSLVQIMDRFNGSSLSSFLC